MNARKTSARARTATSKARPGSASLTASAADADVIQRIVAAARRHFFAHGFRAVTMDDLAAELGMSKKTFYAVFPGKTALLEAVMQDKLSQVEADLETLMSRTDTGFLQTLEALLVCLQRHTAEIQPAYVRDIRRDAPELFQIVVTRRVQMIEKHFGRLFQDGVKAGMVRSDIPVRLMIEILLSATEAIVNPVKVEELGLTPKTAYCAVLEVVLNGALTDNARRKS